MIHIFNRFVTALFLIIMLFTIIGCSTSVKLPVSDTTKQKTTDDGSGMKVHYIDVGQADATLLQFMDGSELRNILIDTGDWNQTDAVDYLKSQGIQTIDIIAISHPHADHIGQLDKIIKAFQVDEVWMNGEMATSQIFEKALEAIETHDVDYYEPEVGDAFDIGPLQIEVLHPTSLSSSTNNNSLVLHVLYDEVSFLFTGDAELQAEKEMLENDVNVQAKILHLGHHGSKTSTSADFLQAVNPEVAIYSAGQDNKYNHPDTEVVQLVNKQNTLLYGTDQDGTIIVKTDGKNYHVSTAQQPITNGECVNINTASKKEVQEIIHIGEILADELIKQRPFKSINELTDINGIGDTRLKDIKKQGIACLGG